MIIEFDFLVAYFQFLQIMLSSLLLTHCLMIGDMFSEILNGYNYVLRVTSSTYIDKHSRLNINDSGLRGPEHRLTSTGDAREMT